MGPTTQTTRSVRCMAGEASHQWISTTTHTNPTTHDAAQHTFHHDFVQHLWCDGHKQNCRCTYKNINHHLLYYKNQCIIISTANAYQKQTHMYHIHRKNYHISRITLRFILHITTETPAYSCMFINHARTIHSHIYHTAHHIASIDGREQWQDTCGFHHYYQHQL